MNGLHLARATEQMHFVEIDPGLTRPRSDVDEQNGFITANVSGPIPQLLKRFVPGCETISNGRCHQKHAVFTNVKSIRSTSNAFAVAAVFMASIGNDSVGSTGKNRATGTDVRFIFFLASSSNGKVCSMRSIPETVAPETSGCMNVVMPIASPRELKRGRPESLRLRLISEVIERLSNLLMMPVVKTLRSCKGLPIVTTLSPSAIEGSSSSGSGSGATFASGTVSRLIHRTATSLSGSDASSFAGILRFLSNCTAIYSEGPTTCWLVRTRPASSIMKPVPLPNSLQTVNTDA